MSVNETKGADCCPYKVAAKGFVAIAFAAVVAGLGVCHLGSDLWALVGPQQESSAEAVAAEQSLPLDAPAVTLARSNEQTAANSQTASGAQDGVVLLNDWSYTQSSASPFLFTAPNGFDFFNPLFALDFSTGSGTSTSNTGSTSTTPFGFNITNNFNIPITTSTGGTTGTAVPGSSSGNTGTTGTAVIPVTVAGSSGSSGTSTTTTVGFLNGAQFFVNVTVTTVLVQPVPIGTGSMSHRHAVLDIVVVVNVVVVNVSPSN